MTVRSMNVAFTVVFAVAVALLLISGCGDGIDNEAVDDRAGAITDIEWGLEFERPHLADHRAGQTVLIREGDEDYDQLIDQGVAHFEFSDSFHQIGWMMAAESVDGMAYRVRIGDKWSDWNSLDAYWSEDRLHNAHVVLDEPAGAMQWRVDQEIEFAELAFSEEVTARDEIVASGTVDADEGGDDISSPEIDTAAQQVAPSWMVTDRYDWNAIDPGKVCGNVVAPWRMTIHHTYNPSSDGTDAGARMRQMQSYHINTHGWCDIGYHFVVAQSGEIFQGRSHSDRPGAHVIGENSGNVGIAMIGDYTTVGPPTAQFDSTVDMVEWVHDEHGVTLDSNSIKGHREWPGQSTVCPGDEGLTYVSDIITAAANQVGGNTGSDDGSSDDGSSDGSTTDDGSDDGSTGDVADDESNVEGCGCAATGTGSWAVPMDALLVVLAVGLLAVRSRRLAGCPK